MVKPGVSTLEIDKFCEDFIRMHGGIPAFKGYGGFPGTICASVNDEVVHGIPSADRILVEGDILSIDTGATVDGWVGDNAWTFAVGHISDEYKALLEVTRDCLALGIEQAVPGNHLGDIGHAIQTHAWTFAVGHISDEYKALLEVTRDCLALGIEQAVPGNHLGDIGHAIQTHAEKHGYGVIREYVGHGIGRKMHEEPNVPNYGRKGHGVKLEVGMCLAIEPMITLGKRHVHTLRNGWTVVTNDGGAAAHFENTIAITADGPIITTVEPGFDPLDVDEGRNASC